MANFKLLNDTELARDVFIQVSPAGRSNCKHHWEDRKYNNSASYVLHWKVRNVMKANEQGKLGGRF